MSTLSLAANIASLGSSGGATAAARSAQQATRMAKMVNNLKTSVAAMKQSQKFKNLEKASEAAGFVQQMNEVSQAQTDEEVLRALAGFDPTGVSQVASAYGRRVCDAPK
jgi:1-deoxy-D-xylulose 5-phosphate reductoisomerase